MTKAVDAEKAISHRNDYNQENGLKHEGPPTTDFGLGELGYESQLQRNRSLRTVLFQSIAIAAVPYGEGSALNSAITGGGQLPFFVGWIVVCILDECIAMSLSELASRFPTSAGPYYWSFQLAKNDNTRVLLSFVTGWAWLVGNWTIALSVNFGMASFIAGTVTMYHPDWVASSWELLLIFYVTCICAMLICMFGNKVLPYVDTAASIWNGLTILIVFISLSASAKVGRHSAADALGYYNQAISGWGGYSFFIGLLPAAYTFSAIGMITSMAEECRNPTRDLPKAISLCIPVAGVAGLFFILPICFTLPPLQSILAVPAAEGLPFVFHSVMGSPGGGLALMFFVLVVTAFCSISVTTAASRCTWAFARDRAIPFSKIWAKISSSQVPMNALILLTLVQMLLGLINLGSSVAFTAFVSVGVIALAVSYAIPITMSMISGRRAVSAAALHWPPVIGWTVNVIAVLWVIFQLILFSMPTTLPVTLDTMNWAIVVFMGFMAISGVYYIVRARKVYQGPPKSDGL